MINNIVLSAMAWVTTHTSRVNSDERGQDLVEYAVLVGAIGIVAFGVLALLGPGAFVTMKDKIANCVSMSSTCG